MSTAVATDDVDGRRRVQVLLGEHVIIDYTAADSVTGEWFAGAMSSQFKCCRVTNKPYIEDHPAESPAATP